MLAYNRNSRIFRALIADFLTDLLDDVTIDHRALQDRDARIDSYAEALGDAAVHRAVTIAWRRARAAGSYASGAPFGETIDCPSCGDPMPQPATDDPDSVQPCPSCGWNAS